MKKTNLRDLLEAGCHFGHEAKRWHPKAASYIYSVKQGIHIIDLLKTKAGLEKAMQFAQKLGQEGKTLLFIGTKKQARAVIQSEAMRVGAPFFSHRWMGGFITNWDEIKKNIAKLNQMNTDKKSGYWQAYPKHEQVLLERKRVRLERVYQGVLNLTVLPDALFIVDIKKETAAVSEANQKGYPIIAIVDTNCDPTPVDYPIPANDDAVKSISIIVNYIAQAYQDGRVQIKKEIATPEKAKTLPVVKPEIKVDKPKKAKKIKKAIKA